MAPRRRRLLPGASVVAWAALLTSIAALVACAGGLAGASPITTAHGSRASQGHGQTTTTASVVHLNSHGLIPAKLIGTVKQALVAEALTAKADAALTKKLTPALAPTCPQNTLDLGSWCVMSGIYPVPSQASGTNNYFYAAQTCQTLGGYLPSAEQLIGAAPLISLESTLTDNPQTSIVDADATNGLSDQREMTATLITTAAGSDAAGSEGVSTTATGNPNENQPDPVPTPADPDPETLQYVTVFDNDNHGGFAGSEPVSQPENFRCGFAKAVGGSAETEIPIDVSAAIRSR